MSYSHHLMYWMCLNNCIFFLWWSTNDTRSSIEMDDFNDSRLISHHRLPTYIVHVFLYILFDLFSTTLWFIKEVRLSNILPCNYNIARSFPESVSICVELRRSFPLFISPFSVTQGDCILIIVFPPRIMCTNLE